MRVFRYSEWDGALDLKFDQDELLDMLESRLLAGNDLSSALWDMRQDGITDRQGRKIASLHKLLQELRWIRQAKLSKYRLDSAMDEIRRKLEQVIRLEKEGIERRLASTGQKLDGDNTGLAPKMRDNILKAIKEAAERNLKKLEDLPPDVAGRMRELADYDFMDDEARQLYQELLDTLKKNVLESYFRDLTQALRGLDPGTLARMRSMVEAVNQMLEQRRRGEEPDFEGFLSEFGRYLGFQPESLDDLIEQLQERIAQAQSLLESLSPDQRASFEEVMNMVLDRATQYELAKLAVNLEILSPGQPKKRYPFSGDEPISYAEALKLMETLHKLDNLESQLTVSQDNRSLDGVDSGLVRELLGSEAAADLEKAKSIVRILEEAGYIRQRNNGYELTPRGIRKIGQKALRSIFDKLRRDTSGQHRMGLIGKGGERNDQTRKYQFGDGFDLHLEKTIMNALYRESARPPVRLSVEDFEVFETERLTRSATVLMLDLSLSMPMRGNFEAAKQVAIALDRLIRSQYPKDTLHIVGFSTYARRIKKEDLVYLNWDQLDPYTNIQHGLVLARKILEKERCSNRQVILISDGEPTAHTESGNFFFQYPPSLHTLQLTLREVKNCTRKGIVINTFMLEGESFLSAFINEMGRLNKGRVFVTNAERLGQYLLLDYVSNKKRSFR